MVLALSKDTKPGNHDNKRHFVTMVIFMKACEESFYASNVLKTFTKS